MFTVFRVLGRQVGVWVLATMGAKAGAGSMGLGQRASCLQRWAGSRAVRNANEWVHSVPVLRA